MSKFYTRLLLIVLGTLMPLAADAAQVTLNIDNHEAISLQMGYSGPIEAKSQTVIEYDADSYPSLYISTKSGYKATVVDQDGNNYPAYYGNITLYLNAGTDGNVYTVTTVNLEEMRTATAHIKIVGSPSSINASRNGGEGFNLVEGDNEIKFIPGEESPFTFRNNDYRPFYRIEVDHEEVTMSDYSINVEVEDGTNIEIEAAYPQIPVELTITVPEEVKGIVTNVTADYMPIDGWTVNAPFEVSAGSQISVQLDVENYALDDIYLNGAEQSPSSYYSFTIGTEPTEVKIKAHNYGVINYTLNVDDPARVAVYEGNSTYGATPIELLAGDNQLTIGEQIGQILIKATTGNDILSITDAEGNPLTLSYGVLTLTDGMSVKIISQPRVYDGQFVVFVNNLSEVATNYDGSLNAYWATENDRDTRNLLQEGYNIVKFATAADEQHMVQVGTKTEPYVAYVNGVLQENPYTSQYYSWYGVPGQGDVIKIFTDGTPGEYTVHVVTTGNAANNVALTVDIATPVPDIADADIEVLEGTLFTVTPPADTTVKVSVDDIKLTADEDGTFSFTATANHNVSISATSDASGITGISDDACAVPAPVYNLQGIKVLDSSADMKQLPAGIYIVNGKKHAVR
jgi:hypothetical protein